MVFASDAHALLVALATVGGVSDFVGRRPGRHLVAGAGFGAGFLGAFRSLVALADPDHRAGLPASVYLVNYLALSDPAVVAGTLVSTFGLHATAVGYGGIVVVLAVVVLVVPGRRGVRAGCCRAGRG